jgi:hypothetical protein
MKREACLLLGKACDSITLSIEFFNRPHDIGRATATLILLDHAFEMLLKASPIDCGGHINCCYEVTSGSVTGGRS